MKGPVFWGEKLCLVKENLGDKLGNMEALVLFFGGHLRINYAGTPEPPPIASSRWIYDMFMSSVDTLQVPDYGK